MGILTALFTHFYPAQRVRLAILEHITVFSSDWKDDNRIFYEVLYILKELSLYNVWLQSGWPGFNPQQRQRILLLASVPRPALRHTQPPIKWVPEVLSPGVKHGWVMTLTTHPHLVLRSSMSRSYTSFPPWHQHGVAVRISFTFTVCTKWIVNEYLDILRFCLEYLQYKKYRKNEHSCPTFLQ
jgi:hypothetical protein